METEHIIKSYDEELSHLRNLVAEMGGLAESQLAAAIEALVRWDLEAAQKVVAGDKRVDAFEVSIDDFTLRLLALRQPMADDLRVVIAALKVSNNLERIGDFAKNIAKRIPSLAQAPLLPGGVNSVARMASMVQAMIKNVLDAFVRSDDKMAADVRLRDAEVDQMYTSLFRELLTYMMENPGNITSCTHLLFIAKNVERIGDHATGIAEQVHFAVHGHRPGEERPKGDETASTVLTPIES